MTNHDEFGAVETPVYHAEPESTSISSVLSMILGLLGCCGGVAAVPGLLLAVVGIVSVSRSRGRVGGMGFAIAGLILSLLNIALWTAAIVAGLQGVNWMKDNAAAPTAQVLQLMEQGDYDGARGAMVPPADGASDEEVDAFVTAYTSQLGGVVSAPGSIGEMFEAYGGVIEGFESFNGRQNYIPMPILFDNGYALVVVEMDPNAMSQSGSAVLEPGRVYVVLPDGTVVSLPEDSSITSAPVSSGSSGGGGSVTDGADPDAAEDAAEDAGPDDGGTSGEGSEGP